MDAEQEFENKLLSTTMRVNSYSPIHTCYGSTGFRTSSLNYGNLDFGAFSVAQEFIANSRCSRHNTESENSIASYFSDSGITSVAMSGQKVESNLIPLSEKYCIPEELQKSFQKRKSSRNFRESQIDFNSISGILFAANGVNKQIFTELSNERKVQANLRTTSSAGGLYPIDLYLAAINVEELAQGIYQYSPISNGLIAQPNGTEKIKLLLSACAMPESTLSLSKASAVVLFVATPWRTMRKYGTRGLKFVYHECGAISQNIHLSAGSLGIGSVDCASLYDQELNQILEIDGVNRFFTHAVVLGIAKD
jgi:SagB-type dehydrogenase family enzyme